MRLLPALSLLLLAASAGCEKPPPPPPPPPPSATYRSQEAINYIGFFKTQDTKQWELAKERLVHLGPGIIPTLFAAMEESAGEVDLLCADVLKRMGPEALPYLESEIRRGDAGFTDRALTRRRSFRGDLIAVLGEIRSAPARDALCRILREDGWSTARRKAAFYLGVQKDPASIPVLIEALRRDRDEGVRAECRGALKACAGNRDMGDNPEVWERWWKERSAKP